MIKRSDISYRDENPAAFDCFRHQQVSNKYTISVFTCKETGFPALGDARIDGQDETTWAFEEVVNTHAQTFADETGLGISFDGQNGRFELSGLDIKYSFEDQAEAEAYAEKIRRFDAECGAVIADFRQQMHEIYGPDPESHLRDRNGFYTAKAIKDKAVFSDFVYRSTQTNDEKASAMQSIADRFHEQHPDYRIGVYVTPCDSVTLFPADYNGRPESLKDAERPTKKFLAGLSPDEMEAHKQLLRDFDRAADDFIYAAASGIDRGLENDFTKAVESLNTDSNTMEM